MKDLVSRMILFGALVFMFGFAAGVWAAEQVRPETAAEIAVERVR